MKVLLAALAACLVLVGCSARTWESGCDVPHYEERDEYWAEAERVGSANPNGDEWRCILLAYWDRGDWDEEWSEFMETLPHLDRRTIVQLRAVVEDGFDKLIDASSWTAAIEIRDEMVSRMFSMLWRVDFNEEEQNDE